MSIHIPISATRFDEVPAENSAQTGESVRKCDNPEDLGISDIQFRAIQLTLTGKNDTEISAALDISRRTLWYWKTHNQPYRAALATLRAQLHATFADRCQNHLITAGNVLVAFMGESTDEKNRLRAAEILFRHGGRYLHLKEKELLQSPQDPQV